MNRYDVTCASDLWPHPEGDYILYADHAAFVAQVREAAERAHAEWCAGKGDSPETVKAVSDAFDRVLALCEVPNG